MVQSKTDQYLVKMVSGNPSPKKWAGEGFYYSQCGKCQYRSRRYRFPIQAETDVQEHLYADHQVRLFTI